MSQTPISGTTLSFAHNKNISLSTDGVCSHSLRQDFLDQFVIIGYNSSVFNFNGGYWLHFETWHDDDYVEGWIYSGVTTAREDGARDLELPELSREVLEIMSGAAHGYSANMDVSFEFNPDGWMITIPAGVNLRWIPEVHPDTKAYETEMTSTYESYMRVTLVDTDQVWYVITDTEYNTPAFVASWVNGLQVDG